MVYYLQYVLNSLASYSKMGCLHKWEMIQIKLKTQQNNTNYSF